MVVLNVTSSLLKQSLKSHKDIFDSNILVQSRGDSNSYLYLTESNTIIPLDHQIYG